MKKLGYMASSNEPATTSNQLNELNSSTLANITQNFVQEAL
jgi:hypothetical protein